MQVEARETAAPGDASGAVLLAGWCAGAMGLGGARIPAGEGAAFFVARYSA